MTLAYEEIIDFIAKGCQPKDVADFHPSEEARLRAASLMSRLKDDSITPEEAAELDDYVQLEHMMRLAKARARQNILHE